MSSTLETPLSSSNHLKYGFLGVKEKPRHSPSLSLSPPFRKKILSQRNSVFSMHNNYIDDAPRKKLKRFSVLSKEEEIDLITKKIGEKILRARKLENLSVNSCNYTTLPTEEKTGTSFRKSYNLTNQSVHYEKKPQKKKLNQILNFSNISQRPITYLRKSNKISLLATTEPKETNEKSLVFKSTAKLNNFLIRDYHISTGGGSASNKFKITEMTLEKINKLKMLQAYNRSKNYLDNSKNIFNSYYEDFINKAKIDNRSYTEQEMKDIKEEYYEYRKNEKLKKSNHALLKIKDLLKEEEYQNHSEGTTINTNNLRRIIKIRKILKRSLDDMNNTKKKQLSQNEQEILMSMGKLGPPSFTKKAFKPRTINKLKAASKTYFGVPV